MSNDQADDFIDIHLGSGPIVAVAIHDGHDVRDEVSSPANQSLHRWHGSRAM